MPAASVFPDTSTATLPLHTSLRQIKEQHYTPQSGLRTAKARSAAVERGTPVLTAAKHAKQATAAHGRHSSADAPPGWDDLSPDVLAMVLTVLGLLDPRTLLMAAPHVCRQWRTVCRERVAANLDVSWAVRGHDAWCKTSPASDTALATLLQRFRGVGTAVNLAYCRQVTKGSLPKLVAGCAGPRLTALSLHCCEQVTDAVLGKLLAGCAQVTSLDLHRCSELTDAALQTVASKSQIIIT